MNGSNGWNFSLVWLSLSVFAIRLRSLSVFEDMRLDIPEVRPAVIDPELAKTLGEYLRFRHVFRNVYGSIPEADRMRPLEQRMPAILASFREQIREFLCWMLGGG